MPLIFFKNVFGFDENLNIRVDKADSGKYKCANFDGGYIS